MRFYEGLVEHSKSTYCIYYKLYDDALIGGYSAQIVITFFVGIGEM